MTLYVDTSALLKRYVDEPDSRRFNAMLSEGSTWLTCRLTLVEIRRNLSRRLEGQDAAAAREAFRADWSHFAVVEVDAALCEDAAAASELTGARSLDAVHLAAVRRAGPQGIALLTADLRQAQAARALGIDVMGS